MLITKTYIRLNKELHAAPKGFGSSSYKWAHVVFQLIRKNNVASVLDYGCGAGTLARGGKDKEQGLLARFQEAGMKVDYAEYDPAISSKAALPRRQFDMVVCTDVLEHIEPECLDEVLEHIKSLTLRFAFVVVNTNAANKILLDGRNAHLIVQPKEWWLKELKKHFSKVKDFPVPDGREAKEIAAVLS